MRIYISADMEGTAGVCSWRQCDPENHDEYPIYRRYMTREVRAAIEGARSAGASEFLINDSHWSMYNLVWGDLPEDVRVVSGAPKPYSMGERIDAGVNAVFLTGYHAKAGDRDGVLAHTFSDSTVYRVTINGTECSEALLVAALAGAHGIPVVLVTGDRTIVTEALHYLPWASGVVVKDAIGFNSVNSLTPHAACAAIRDGAREAVTSAARAEPFAFTPPIELLLETVRVENCDYIELMPGFERISGRTVRYTASDYVTAYRAYVAAVRIGSAANTVA